MAAALGIESAPNTLGESKHGTQYQSTEPLTPTRAAVCMFPTSP